MRGHLVYECRMCGEKILGPEVPSIPHALYCAMNDTPVPVTWHGLVFIALRVPHPCKRGPLGSREGVAELIGGVGEDIKTLMRNKREF